MKTTVGITWTSILDLSPNFFAKKAIFSIASTIGKPLIVDIKNKNQIRPSCARAKVEVDLVDNMQHRVRINEEDDVTRERKFKLIKIKYDYKPKYWKELFART